LEFKLKEREEECNSLRQTLSVKEQELNALRSQLQNQTIINHSLLNNSHTVNFNSPVPMINLPSRNYVLIPNPNPQQIGTEREAFKEKIDYSKIQLRKTDSLLEGEFILFSIFVVVEIILILFLLQTNEEKFCYLKSNGKKGED
jgi:hypothetical protein